MGSIAVKPDKDVKGQCVVTSGRSSFLVHPPRFDLEKQAGYIIPYFFVKPALLAPQEANMEMYSVKCDKCTIPMMKNKKPLDMGSELLLDAEPKAKKAKR